MGCKLKMVKHPMSIGPATKQLAVQGRRNLHLFGHMLAKLLEPQLLKSIGVAPKQATSRKRATLAFWEILEATYA
jgi:hypothetical protein